MYTQEKGSVCRYGSGIEKDGASVSMSEVIKTLNEIETLREALSSEQDYSGQKLQEVLAAEAREDKWKRQAAAEKLANTVLVKASEEWERRAFSVWRWMAKYVACRTIFLRENPEAEEWFE